MATHSILDAVKQLAAIANIGLLYSKNEYDQERYTEVQNIALGLLQQVTDHPLDALKEQFALSKDYPTAKVDIRALVVNDAGEILLAREMADGKWSLPGGWADVGYSPIETAIKECKEETGIDVSVERLLAVFDKKMHSHPPQPFYVYKLVFLCRPLHHQLQKGFDVLDVQYFPLHQLPELSLDRILPSQIELLYKKVQEKDETVYCD